MARANHPRYATINGRRYVSVAVKVQSRYEDGTPEDLTLIPDNQMVELVGGEEFLLVYVLESVVNK